ncbi:hypothetical protein DFQ28_001590 [Apophysomyces sp. BC1034]|nr:hypothetical protein DFQ30_008025 [Apophysomyces sp. BC1015]KAG0178433.1 hypothetical protein DFQ29_003476 [Apophysomyces sp. BC1021]KAG0194098.1 hypothetical protein DFQ28_001590 [Apophysomyces sp. BC1034]
METPTQLEGAEFNSKQTEEGQHASNSSSDAAAFELSGLSLTAEQLQQINAVQADAIAQAAAAAMAASGSGYHQIFAHLDTSATAAVHQPPNARTGPLEEDSVKREMINEKVRAENRERKKRWREQNEERNKDNDLRCRVNKRAQKLFGNNESDHKRRWVEEEFAKRRMKRHDKERRKHGGNAGSSDSMALPQFQTPSQQHIQAVHDSQYLSMLSNNLALSSSKMFNIDFSEEEKSQQQFSQHLIELLQQHHEPSLDQHHAFSSTASSTTSTTVTTPVQPIDEKTDSVANDSRSAVSNHTNDGGESPRNDEQLNQENTDQQSNDYPIDAVITLMQLNAGWRQ